MYQSDVKCACALDFVALIETLETLQHGLQHMKCVRLQKQSTSIVHLEDSWCVMWQLSVLCAPCRGKLVSMRGYPMGMDRRSKLLSLTAFFYSELQRGVTEIRTSFLLNTEIRCVFKNKIMIKISRSCWDKKLALFHCSGAAATSIRREGWFKVIGSINYYKL